MDDHRDEALRKLNWRETCKTMLRFVDKSSTCHRSWKRSNRLKGTELPHSAACSSRSPCIERTIAE